MTAPTETTQFQVTAPMIQLQSKYPGPQGPGHAQPDRLLRSGDVLPFWVSGEEIERLLDGGFIEALP